MLLMVLITHSLLNPMHYWPLPYACLAHHMGSGAVMRRDSFVVSGAIQITYFLTYVLTYVLR